MLKLKYFRKRKADLITLNAFTRRRNYYMEIDNDPASTLSVHHRQHLAAFLPVQQPLPTRHQQQ